MRRALLKAMFSLLLLAVLCGCGAASAPTPTLTPTADTSAAGTPSPTPGVVPSSTSTRPPAPTPTTSPTELQSIILQAFRLQAEHSHRQRSNVILSDGRTFETVVDYVPPDRYRIVPDAGPAFVVIEQKVYVQDQEGWAESELTAAQIVDFDLLERLERSLRKIQFVGTDSADGMPVRGYAYEALIKAGETESTGRFELWVGEADGLPYKLVVDGVITSVDTTTGEAVGVPAVTSMSYEYDPSIDISPPIQ